MCRELWERMVSVQVFLMTCRIIAVERGDLINHFLPAWEREALPVNRCTHTVMVWDSLLCVVPLALPSSEPLLWKTWTHPPLPPRPLGPRPVSVCVEAVGGPYGNLVTVWPCASVAGLWCSPAAGGPCGSPWMWGLWGIAGVHLQCQRLTGQCSQGVLGVAHGSDFLSVLRNKDEDDETHKKGHIKQTVRSIKLILIITCGILNKVPIISKQK